MSDVKKTPLLLISVSLMWAIYKVDITSACLKLGARAAPQTVKHALDIL